MVQRGKKEFTRACVSKKTRNLLLERAAAVINAAEVATVHPSATDTPSPSPTATAVIPYPGAIIKKKSPRSIIEKKKKWPKTKTSVSKKTAIVPVPFPVSFPKDFSFTANIPLSTPIVAIIILMLFDQWLRFHKIQQPN